MMRVVGVIPARYKSSRMPGKPIAAINGKPLIWWVYHQAIKSELLSDLFVATDDGRIYDVCKELGIKVMMTSQDHDTPTSRLYEVSTEVDADLYLQIMGDEPLINHECFSLIIPDEATGKYVGVLSNVLVSPADVIDISNQKVVSSKAGNALFISRSPIPYPKGTLDFEYEKVTGVQIFSREALSFYNCMPRSRLEIAEENDLMRFIENGVNVKVIRSPYKTVSVDMPKDLEMVREMLKEKYGGYQI